MVGEIGGHIEKALWQYTQGDHFDTLLEARRKYKLMIGAVDEENDEYEASMNCFNDWYIFQFNSERLGCRIIDDYLKKESVVEDLAHSFTAVKYSLFEFVKINFRRQVVLKDLVRGEKLALVEEQKSMPLLDGDMFIGRIINLKDGPYLLKGMCFLPTEIKDILNKRLKKLRKLNNEEEIKKFLINLESLKAKWLRFGKIDIHKIFIF